MLFYIELCIILYLNHFASLGLKKNQIYFKEVYKTDSLLFQDLIHILSTPKAVLKYALSEAKVPNAVLKLFFRTRINEIWMRGY